MSANDRISDQMLKDLEKVIGDKPIEDVAPLLIVAVARLLVIDAGGDKSKLTLLLAKFLGHLMETIHDMVGEGDEARH